ncbi:hypothetical protein [Desulfofalx alkaliphila]|uniref:hypothetical protein n=1 Tax=Desulfofalx alkaliphila TaxID=105483 RepID=UPI0004E2878D|nr:hypothetical protein [Desulfofalx alkaliphila]
MVDHISNNATPDIELVGEVYYREALRDLQQEVDVVIISESLPGTEDFVSSTILHLRELGIRVVLLPGDEENERTKELINKCTPLGVYDYVFNTVTIDEIVSKILKPSTIKDVKEIQEAQNDADDSQKWFAAKKNISDVRQYLLPGSLLQDTQFSTMKTNYDKENANDETKKESFLGRFFNPPEARVEQKEQFKESPTTSKVLPIQETPTVVLGLGNQNLNDWFKNTFSGLVEILASTTTPDEFKQAVGFYNPDIAIIMRPSPMGGLPEADVLAKWATHQVHAVLFVAGELDEQGTVMADTVKSAGGHVLSCPPGETISGDELVLLMRSIITELPKEISSENTEVKTPKIPTINLEALKKEASQLSSVLKLNGKKKKTAEIKIPIENMPRQNNKQNTNPTAIVAGGLFAVVSPWRPGLAGSIAAEIGKMLAEETEGPVAVIGATGHSTAALWLEVPEEELILSDWRVPGSQAPVVINNINIWAVDPVKSLHTKVEEELLDLVASVRQAATYTVIDLASDMELAQKLVYQKNAVILVVLPGTDLVEYKTSLFWLNRLKEGKENIVTGIDLRGVSIDMPEDIKPTVVIETNPAETLKKVLKKNLDEFVWL